METALSLHLSGVLDLESFHTLPEGLSPDYFYDVFERNFTFLNFDEVRPVLGLLCV